MTKQTELMLVEEFSEKELESISGGISFQKGVVNVNVEDNKIEIIKNSVNNNDVEVNILTSR